MKNINRIPCDFFSPVDERGNLRNGLTTFLDHESLNIAAKVGRIARIRRIDRSLENRISVGKVVLVLEVMAISNS